MPRATKNIDSGASPDEWNDLYKWVEERTLAFLDTDGDARNPWLMPDRSEKQIIKHIHQSQDGGWMGPYGGMF